MNTKNREAIKDIKKKILAMLEERHALEQSSTGTATPSKYWSDFCSTFDYMLGLDEEYFDKLRLHTYHLTGDNYQKYFFEKGKDSMQNEWNILTKTIPAEYIISEPEGGIGFQLADGRMISMDLLRYQHSICTLYHNKVLANIIKNPGARPVILEIGAGYGALAHHLSRIIGHCTCIIVDLPETLIFSASYLTLLNPDKKLYLYEKNTFSRIVQQESIKDFDFIFIPNYKLSALSNISFDLVMNVASFQEMKKEQVKSYLDFIAKTCTGYLYSWNQNVKPKNREPLNVTNLLKEHFELNEISKITWQEKITSAIRLQLKKIAASLGLIDKTRVQSPDWHYHEYLCTTRIRK